MPPRSRGRRIQRRQRLQQSRELLVEVYAGRGGLQAEEILPLADENNDANAGGEADDHRVGYVFDHRSETRRAQAQQHHTRHQRRQLQAGDAMLGGDDRQHRDEGAGRSGDLQPGTAEQRRAQPGDDRGVQPLFRPRS
jgi:hypothetical protein